LFAGVLSAGENVGIWEILIYAGFAFESWPIGARYRELENQVGRGFV